MDAPLIDAEPEPLPVVLNTPCPCCGVLLDFTRWQELRLDRSDGALWEFIAEGQGLVLVRQWECTGVEWDSRARWDELDVVFSSDDMPE
jgi:hypothetical protein